VVKHSGCSSRALLKDLAAAFGDGVVAAVVDVTGVGTVPQLGPGQTTVTADVGTLVVAWDPAIPGTTDVLPLETRCCPTGGAAA
jgi:hypothetical protein